MNTDSEVVHAADALTAWISGVSAETKELARNVTSLLEEKNPVGKSRISKTGLVGLDEVAREFLAKKPYAVGAWIFLSAASVEEGGRSFEWWVRTNSGGMERVDADRTPGSTRYYDYEKLPFFSTAASTREQALSGPYVDFLGFEEYILSFTAPFSVHGSFMGVAGCDIRIKDLEPLIMPNLLAVPSDAALINASNRVVLGNSGRYLVGERIKPEAPGQHRIALDVPHLGLSLIYGE
ncbi:cache domain-containing protein [Arthrobacter sp. P2b]|uniref:cache domain-containing protein n=1 Tax=Arthrobacter sp. P2b TaxID=1938741 RepID=UPI0009A77D54|nr:cache domain-containing protein [Arthrobacter sp. P2b]SLK10425.1 hypothetical protein SAMN06272721_11334 [Arthrobacter sp. P2b]